MMGKVKIFKKKVESLQEEDVNQGTQQPAENPNAENLRQLEGQKAQLIQDIADIQKKCADDVAQKKQLIAQIDKQIADLGGHVNVTESADIVGLGRVNESIYSDNGKRDEISAILKEAIDNADLSYTFSEKECDNYARYLIDKMNDVSSTWKKSEDNWDKFEEILVDYKKVTSKFGSSDKEMTRLKESLKKSFYVKANSYTWVFGND